MRRMLVLGLMSGTSADGIDVALARVEEAGSRTRPGRAKARRLRVSRELVGHCTLRMNAAVRAEVLRVAEGGECTAGEISQMNFRLGEEFAAAALAACKKFGVKISDVGLIGSHGQTIFHQGDGVLFLGKKTASTLQIGEPAVIAARTGVPTIGDFRVADMAVGGQGAPLVPFADYILYRHSKLGRISLNIGGIANVTVISPNAKPSDVFAFDTGPGNMLIDALVQHFTNGRQRFDKDAVLARRGQLSRQLMRRLLQDPYLKQKPPKSTGREYFGKEYAKKLLALGRRYNLRPNDLIRTVTVFTAVSVIDALHRFVLPKHKINEIIVSGGGALNFVIFEALSVFAMCGANPSEIYSARAPKTVAVTMYLPGSSKNAPRKSRLQLPEHGLISVVRASHFGIPSEAKEAYAFALLAYETWMGRTGNLPSATGAERPVVLGKICF